MFCFHRWKIDKVSFTPPNNRVISVTGYSLSRSIFEGTTNIYMRCVKCGKLDTDKCYGEYKPSELEKK